MNDLDDASDESPLELGDYRIGRRVGVGGFGVVHRALRSDGVEVAMKFLLDADTLDPAWHELKNRFRNEAGVMAALAAVPGIARIYDSGTLEGGLDYIAMEFLRGGTLHAVRERYRGRYRSAAEVICRVARAIAGAHRQGVVHRDLKPGNIMFRADSSRLDDLVVTDFGLAVHWNQAERWTQTGTFLGTPDFAALEQLIDTKHVGEPTDVYAIGVTLFHLVTGTLPTPRFAGNFAQYVHRRTTDPPANLADKCRAMGMAECPPDLSHLCLRCLVRLDQGRILRAGDVADELEEFLGAYRG